MITIRRTLIISLMILLTACTGAAQSAATSEAVGPLNTSYQNALPIPSQLAIGMLELKGTPNAVDKSEAAELLPLWKGLRVLGQSSTAAPQEIQALIKQIQSTMKPEQVQAIADLKLTEQNLTAYLGQNGGAFGGQGSNPSQQATRQAARQSGQGGIPGGPPGGFEGGIPGGGGFGGSGFGGTGAQTTRTPSAGNFSSRQGSTGINIFLVNLVIQFLQGIQ
jgi:hypothetical protein